MPSKRPSPLEDPPSASSSSEESEEVEAERDEEESEEEEEEDEEEEEEEEEEQVQTASAKPSVKKPVPNSKPNSAPTASSTQPRSNSDSDEETDAESGSDSEPSPEKPKSSGQSRGADPNIKPISSKPMSDNAKPKKSSSSAAPTAAAAAAATSTPVKPNSSSSKRSLDVDKSEKESNQKKKKKKSGDAEEEDGHVEETDKKQGEDSKKLFQRLWSDEDEIVILKGVLSYMKKGLNPSSNLSAFLDSIKDSLHIEVNKGQLNSKLTRMKQRYMNQASRSKNGQDPNFSKPHELKAYQLSKKIWGGKEGKEEGAEVNNGGRDSVSTDGKKSKSGKTGNGVASSQPKVLSVPESHREVVETEDEERLMSLVQFGKNLAMPPPVLGDFVAKEGLSLIGSSKVKEFDQRWKKILAAETKIYLQRLDLAREYTKSVLDGLEPSDS